MKPLTNEDIKMLRIFFKKEPEKYFWLHAWSVANNSLYRFFVCGT